MLLESDYQAGNSYGSVVSCYAAIFSYNTWEIDIGTFLIEMCPIKPSTSIYL